MPAQSLPGEGRGRHPVAITSQDCFGSARCRRRRCAPVTFLSGKVTKAIARGHADLADFLSARLPSALAERRPRRTRTSMCSNMRRLLRRSAARLGVMHGAGKLAHRRPSMACACEICSDNPRGSPSFTPAYPGRKTLVPRFVQYARRHSAHPEASLPSKSVISRRMSFDIARRQAEYRVLHLGSGVYL